MSTVQYWCRRPAAKGIGFGSRGVENAHAFLDPDDTGNDNQREEYRDNGDERIDMLSVAERGHNRPHHQPHDNRRNHPGDSFTQLSAGLRVVHVAHSLISGGDR